MKAFRGRGAAIRAVAGIALMTALSGCLKPTPFASPDFPFRDRYATRAGAPVLLGNAAWWRRMHDPVLDRLMDRALDDSLSLALARERVVAARAALAADAPPATLSGTARAGVQGGRSDGVDSDPDTVGAGTLGLSWLLDPWGARRNRLKALAAEVEVADAERDSAQLLLLLNLGQSYVDLRYSERLLALREGERAGRLRTLELTRTLAEAEAATRLETTRSRARVAEIEAQLPGLRAAVAARRNEIAVLAALRPGDLDDLLARTRAEQPMAALSPEIGVPADLLRNRPDIRVAERQYYAAVARIDEARAALYPSLSLTGTLNVNALSRSGRGADYFLGPSVRFPVLPDGSTRAEVARRHSLARQAHINWSSTVLQAILEVENALVDYQATAVSVDAARRAVRLNRESLELTREVVRRGDATLNDLIDAEQAVSSSEQALAETLQRLGRSFVELNVRLGAGHGTGSSQP